MSDTGYLLRELAKTRAKIKHLQVNLWRTRQSRDRWRAEAMDWRHAFEGRLLRSRPDERIEQFARDRRYREHRP